MEELYDDDSESCNSEWDPTVFGNLFEEEQSVKKYNLDLFSTVEEWNKLFSMEDDETSDDSSSQPEQHNRIIRLTKWLTNFYFDENYEQVSKTTPLRCNSNSNCRSKHPLKRIVNGKTTKITWEKRQTIIEISSDDGDVEKFNEYCLWAFLNPLLRIYFDKMCGIDEKHMTGSEELWSFFELETVLSTADISIIESLDEIIDILIRPVIRSIHRNSYSMFFSPDRFEHLTTQKILVVRENQKECYNILDNSVQWFETDQMSNDRLFQKDCLVLVDEKIQTIRAISRTDIGINHLREKFDEYLPSCDDIYSLEIPKLVSHQHEFIRDLFFLHPDLMWYDRLTEIRHYNGTATLKPICVELLDMVKKLVMQWYQQIDPLYQPNSVFFSLDYKTRNTAGSIFVKIRVDSKFKGHRISTEDLAKKLINEIKSNPGNLAQKIIPRYHDDCSICWTEKASELLVPCGHRTICQECYDFDKHIEKCPICREDVKYVSHFVLDRI